MNVRDRYRPIEPGSCEVLDANSSGTLITCPDSNTNIVIQWFDFGTSADVEMYLEDSDNNELTRVYRPRTDGGAVSEFPQGLVVRKGKNVLINLSVSITGSIQIAYDFIRYSNIDNESTY